MRTGTRPSTMAPPLCSSQLGLDIWRLCVFCTLKDKAKHGGKDKAKHGGLCGSDNANESAANQQLRPVLELAFESCGLKSLWVMLPGLISLGQSTAHIEGSGLRF